MISRNALKFDWRVKYLYHYNNILICIAYTTIGSNKNSDAKFNPFPKVKGKTHLSQQKLFDDDQRRL